MSGNNRVEDITLTLTSSGHYTLKGIVFVGGTNTTTKLRNTVVNINNSSAVYTGNSIVTGVELGGTGNIGPASFSYNSIKGSTINVYSNGSGKKRGLLVSNTNVVTTRDTNVYVARPTSTASIGSSLLWEYYTKEPQQKIYHMARTYYKFVQYRIGFIKIDLF
jgi:hypothetical protein